MIRDDIIRCRTTASCRRRFGSRRFAIIYKIKKIIIQTHNRRASDCANKTTEDPNMNSVFRSSLFL
jgi:hypothetical protein